MLQNYAIVLQTKAVEQSYASFIVKQKKLECFMDFNLQKNFNCKKHSRNTFVEQRVGSTYLFTFWWPDTNSKSW